MDGDVRVTTMIVGLLIAFCAVLLAKWLAVVAIAAVVLVAVLRFALRRVVAAVRARREERRATVSVPAVTPAPVPVPSMPRASGPTCTWCGLTGGHQDLHGRHVRPRHAHAGALTRM